MTRCGRPTIPRKERATLFCQRDVDHDMPHQVYRSDGTVLIEWGNDGSERDQNDQWHPPFPTVTFTMYSYETWFRGTRWVAYVNSVGIWAMQSQRHFRGKTKAEALCRAIEHARKVYPEEMAHTPDPPKICYLP